MQTMNKIGNHNYVAKKIHKVSERLLGTAD